MDPSQGVSIDITYLDLFGASYEDFLRELVLTHAILQHKASGNGAASLSTSYEGMNWWYSLVVPTDASQLPRRWCLVENATDYKSMLDTVASYLDCVEVTIELTNDISFVTPDVRVADTSFASTIPILRNDLFAPRNPIHDMGSAYPCLVRLSRVPEFYFPPTHVSNPPAPFVPKQFTYHISAFPLFTQQSIRLFLRPAETISRRYSLPFDNHTPGLSGVSKADFVRVSVPLATTFDTLSSLNLVREPEGFGWIGLRVNDVGRFQVVYVAKAE